MNTRLALTGRAAWVRPVLIVAALAVALAAYLLLAAPAAGRHRETLAEATAARNTAHGAAWETRQAAAGAAAAERDQILRDGQAASDRYAEEWRVKVAKARAPHEKAAAAATEQNFTDRVLAQQARSETVGTELAVEKAPEVVESEARGKRNRIVNECARSSGLFGPSTECVKKADAAAEKHRGTKDARVKAAAAEHAKAIKAVEAAEAAQLKSYRAWEAATAAADEAESKVTGAGDPIVPAEKRAAETYADGVAAADAALADAKASADAELADVRGRADLLRSVSNSTGLAVAGAGVLAAAVLAWPLLTRGGRRVAQNERARRVPLTAVGIVRRAGGALTTAAVWLVQGWARAATWVMQQRRGGRLGRAFESATVSGLQAGAFAPAELLKGSAMSHGWDTSKPQKAVSGVRIAVLVSVLTMAGMAIATRLGAPAEATVAETGMAGFSYFLAHLVPLSWVVFGGPVVAVAAAGVGHALPLDAPMPAPAAPGATIGTVGLAALDPDTTALASALGDKYATAVAEGTVPAAASVRHDNGRVIEARLPAGMVASQFRKTDAAEKLAASLFIPLKRVRVMPSDTPAVLRVEVLDVDPEDLPVEGFPLLEGATFDFTKPVPVGLTSERERVEVTFHKHAALFVGQRGSGKTTAMRNVAAAAAIDPDVRLFIVDMKGEDDWSMFAGRADMFVCDTDPRRAEQVIDAAVAERQKRSDLKRANPGMRFPTLLLVIDEFQSLSDSAMVKLEQLIKKSRSTAVDVVLGTQAPTKRAGVAVDMLEQIDVRWISKVESDTMADKVFPRGFREEGVDVSKTRMGRGRAWVVADGQYRLVQTYSTDADDITAMVRRGPQRAPAPADYDAARESAEEAESGCKWCGGPVPAGKENGFCSDRCRMAYKRSLSEAVNRA